MFKVRFTPDEDTREMMSHSYESDGFGNYRPAGYVAPYSTVWAREFATREEAEAAIHEANPNPAKRHEYEILPSDPVTP